MLVGGAVNGQFWTEPCMMWASQLGLDGRESGFGAIVRSWVTWRMVKIGVSFIPRGG